MRLVLHSAILSLLIITALRAQDFRSDRPDQVWLMPPELEEISGLAFAPGDRWLLAVQDEWGTLYGLDPGCGRVDRTWPMAEKGDFEGVAVSDSLVWMLRSDGRLFFSRWAEEGPTGETGVLKTGFPKGTDLEGLAWDPRSRLLLVAAKDQPGEHPDGVKGWLRIDPHTGVRDTVLQGLDREGLRRAVQTQVDKSARRRILKWLSGEPDRFLLGPSAIALHPVDGAIYVASSRGKLLMVFEPDGALRRVYPLDKQVLLQPEGLAFNRAGDLFIASEGKKGVPGRIAVYRDPFKIPVPSEPVGD
jgi:uncharacterized protein YjiK